MIYPRSWTVFALGSGIAFFTSLAGIGTKLASASCSPAMWLALFGGPAAAGPVSACIAAGAMAVLSAAVAAGLAAYGSEQGWVFEGSGAAIGKRDGYSRFIDTNFGLAHNYDADSHRMLNLTYGAMLDTHNTTIVAVTWVETLAEGNYTGSPFAHLNMTHGRVVTLNDNGVIRTAIGPTTSLGQIIEGFNEFKTTNMTAPSPAKRASSETVNWLSYNTYGENMKEGGTFEEALDEDANASKESNEFGVDGWSESFDYYASSFCLGASPPGNGQGQNSIIVGEIHTNSYGGIDSICDSG